MLETSREKFVSQIIAFGTFFTVIFVLVSQVSDPVNVTKQTSLALFAFAAAGVVLFQGAGRLWADSRVPLIAGLSFQLFALSAVLHSKSPLSQNIYGVYGRNTGFLTYLSLTLIFFAALYLRKERNFARIIYALLLAGMVNVIYCLWVVLFGDFVGWSNPYKNILGTFGNPNFIGSFLGIFISILATNLFKPGLSKIHRASGILIILIALVEVKASHAVQGVVVTMGGLSILGFYLIRDKFKSQLIPSLYTALVAFFGFVALMGALQIGPLTKIVYKTSVSLRGEYWQAGWNMGQQFPFTGVGMDAYGDWYRRMRDSNALIFPGPNTVTNAAHNVLMDLFAYGGWPLLLSYVFLLLLSIIAIVKVTLRQRKFDVTFVSLTVGWICYQVQSIISINQVGLAICGWILGGCLIAYEISTRENINVSIKNSKNILTRKSKQNSVQFFFSPQIVAVQAGLLGLLLAVPPLNADLKWKSAASAGNLPGIEKVLQPSYLMPYDSNRNSTIVLSLEQSKLYDQAVKYARFNVEYNPESFDAWRTLYSLSLTTPEEKIKAKAQLIRLDPLNPEIKLLP
jgi:hypothetical protein